MNDPTGAGASRVEGTNEASREIDVPCSEVVLRPPSDPRDVDGFGGFAEAVGRWSSCTQIDVLDWSTGRVQERAKVPADQTSPSAHGSQTVGAEAVADHAATRVMRRPASAS